MKDVGKLQNHSVSDLEVPPVDHFQNSPRLLFLAGPRFDLPISALIRSPFQYLLVRPRNSLLSIREPCLPAEPLWRLSKSSYAKFKGHSAHRSAYQ